MENYSDTNLSYLLFSISKQIYAVHTDYVQSTELLTKVTPIIDEGVEVRGGVIYQDKFVNLIDLRSALGIDSQAIEFEKVVQVEQRIKDHDNWIKELENSIKEKKEFLLTDNPHKCAFGKWIYSFTTDNNILSSELNKAMKEHELFHYAAKDIKNMMKKDNYQKASDLFNQLKHTHYFSIMQMLNSLKETYSNNLRELYMIISHDKTQFGIIVDSIVGIEELKNIEERSNEKLNDNYFKLIARRYKDNSVIYVLDVESFYNKIIK